MPAISELHEDWIDPCSMLDEEDTDLTGVESNGGSIMAFVNSALKRSGNSIEVQNAYRRSAMGGNYDHLLAVSMQYLGD